MKNVLLIISAIIIVLTVTVIIRFAYQKPLAKNELALRGNVFKVEVADTALSRMRGLSGRQSLGKDEGMLFVFPVSAQYTFWMKGMKFPLDLVWIQNGSVIGVTMNVPTPTSTFDFATYLPPSPVSRVLEVNAGTVERLGVSIGDKIEIKLDK